MAASLPTALIAPSPNSSRQRFVDAESYATERGVDIVDAEPGSSTRLLVSRTGGSYETIAAVAIISRIPFLRWPFYTISTSMNYGTTFS